MRLPRRHSGRTLMILYPWSLALALTGQCTVLQSSPPIHTEPNADWSGKRIVMLRGFGDYFARSSDGETKLG